MKRTLFIYNRRSLRYQLLKPDSKDGFVMAVSPPTCNGDKFSDTGAFESLCSKWREWIDVDLPTPGKVACLELDVTVTYGIPHVEYSIDTGAEPDLPTLSEKELQDIRTRRSKVKKRSEAEHDEDDEDDLY
jgi:hypothetical protein